VRHCVFESPEPTLAIVKREIRCIQALPVFRCGGYDMLAEELAILTSVPLAGAVLVRRRAGFEPHRVTGVSSSAASLWSDHVAAPGWAHRGGARRSAGFPAPTPQASLPELLPWVPVKSMIGHHANARGGHCGRESARPWRFKPHRVLRPNKIKTATNGNPGIALEKIRRST